MEDIDEDLDGHIDRVPGHDGVTNVVALGLGHVDYTGKKPKVLQVTQILEFWRMIAIIIIWL